MILEGIITLIPSSTYSRQVKALDNVITAGHSQLNRRSGITGRKPQHISADVRIFLDQKGPLRLVGGRGRLGTG